MRFFAVSDLHIYSEADPLYRSLLSLLRDKLEAGDTLILAGDIFDLFVGNKQVFLDRYSEFQSALREAGGRGANLHYIEGNHDFLIRRAFEGIPGLQIHPHHVITEIAGKKFFVAHGDTVDQGDYGYRFLRGLFRSPFMKAFVALLPGRWVDRIGQRSSEKSRGRNQKLIRASECQTEKAQYLRRVFRNYAAERLAEGYDFVVLGHCHDLDEMKFRIGSREGQYVNVGFPRVHGSFLSWSPEDAAIQRERLP